MKTIELLKEELVLKQGMLEAYKDLPTETMTVAELYDNLAHYEEVREEVFTLQLSIEMLEK